MEKETYTTGQFAKMANVSLRTIRFYDKEGLLNPSFVGTNGYRYYTKDDFLKLQQILSLKFLGFSLDQIKTMAIDTKEDFGKSLAMQRKMIKRKIDLLNSTLAIIDDLRDSIDDSQDIKWDRIIDLFNITNMEKTIVEHYENSHNLAVRINLHEKYSTNKQGWYQWLLSLIDFDGIENVLEIGCGDGTLWQKTDKKSLDNKKILLTDNSEGMVLDARKHLGDLFEYAVLDGSRIEVEDAYDLIIANHVLFYLNDINKALANIAKALKGNGLFMCSSYGENHLREITMLCNEFDSRIRLSDVELYERFGKQNGYEILSRYFKTVNWHEYEDRLVVDNTDDLYSYVLSCHGNQNEMLKGRFEEFKQFLRDKAKDGPLIITKEAGCFICHN